MKMAREIGKWIVTVVVVVTAPIWMWPYFMIRGFVLMVKTAHEKIWERD